MAYLMKYTINYFTYQHKDTIILVKMSLLIRISLLISLSFRISLLIRISYWLGEV